MDKDVEKYLYDALESIHFIKIHLQNIKDFSAVSKSMLVQDSSINVTNIRKVISLRHILIHDYDKIEIQAVWLILTKNSMVLNKDITLINGSSIN